MCPLAVLQNFEYGATLCSKTAVLLFVSLYTDQQTSQLENFGMGVCNKVAILFIRCYIDETCLELERGIQLVEVCPSKIFLNPLLV